MSKSLLDTQKGVCFMCGRYGPTENFKEINGFNGKYLIGDHGTVVSTEFRNNITTKKRHKKIKATDNGNGYQIVFLGNNGKRERHYVHRLVAEAFLPKAEGKDVVNHKDWNKRNNAVENLEWCTQKENIKHSADRMRHPKAKCKPTSTGHKYISIYRSRGKQYYRLQIKSMKVCKLFAELDDALLYRKEVLNV